MVRTVLWAARSGMRIAGRCRGRGCLGMAAMPGSQRAARGVFPGMPCMSCLTLTAHPALPHTSKPCYPTCPSPRNRWARSTACTTGARRCRMCLPWTCSTTCRCLLNATCRCLQTAGAGGLAPQPGSPWLLPAAVWCCRAAARNEQAAARAAPGCACSAAGAPLVAAAAHSVPRPLLNAASRPATPPPSPPRRSCPSRVRRTRPGWMWRCLFVRSPCRLQTLRQSGASPPVRAYGRCAAGPARGQPAGLEPLGERLPALASSGGCVAGSCVAGMGCLPAWQHAPPDRPLPVRPPLLLQATAASRAW